MAGHRTVSRAKMLDRMVNDLLIEVITIRKSRCLCYLQDQVGVFCLSLYTWGGVHH